MAASRRLRTELGERAELLAFVDTRPEPGFADELTAVDQLRTFAPDATTADLDFARTLRDDLARCLLTSSGAIDDLCMRLEVRPSFTAPHRMRWTVTAPERLRALTTRLVTALIELWTTGDIEHARVCAADNCIVPFVDTSPTQKREFCSPKCATRTRVRRHRARQAP